MTLLRRLPPLPHLAGRFIGLLLARQGIDVVLVLPVRGTVLPLSAALLLDLNIG